MKKHCQAETENLFIDPNCEHTHIQWGALQHAYLDDGRAVIWQVGACRDCRKKMQIDYTACPPRPFIDTTK